MKRIKIYKGIDLKYCESDGLIYFNFEGEERKTKYIFEAKQIINEPVWEECSLEGYFLDGYIDKFIGLAKATKRNIKDGKPYWLFKGQYDNKYNIKDKKVYLKNETNDRVYHDWEEQRKIYYTELNKLNNIAESIAPTISI